MARPSQEADPDEAGTYSIPLLGSGSRMPCPAKGLSQPFELDY